MAGVNLARVILDTDILSEVLKRKDPRVLARAEAYLDEHQRLTITAISVLEVVAGWHRRQREDRVTQFVALLDEMDVLPIDADAAILAGRIEADLARLGRPVGRADSMIAAVASTRGLPLVTGNGEHYSRIRDLGVPIVLDDWRRQAE